MCSLSLRLVLIASVTARVHAQAGTIYFSVPQPVTSLQATAVSSDSVLVNWSAPSSAFLVESYRISYQISGYGNCTESPTTNAPPETVTVSAPTTSYRIQGLATWTAYRIVVTSANRIGTSVDRIASVVTSADVPVTKVQGLTSSDTHPTSVTIQWTSPACRYFLGYVQQYQLSLYSQMNLIRSVNVTLTSFTVEGLEPYTTYATRVALMNEVGVGPLNEPYNFSTSEDVPSSPRNLALQAAGNTSLLIAWQAPQSPNGILLQYRVTYRATSDRSGALITRLLAPQGQTNQAELLNLNPYTVYNISVAARTSVGWGPESAHLSARTDESVPSAPASLVLISRNESCLTVNWGTPVVPNGVILTYRIHYQQGLSYSTGQDQVPETGTLEVPANRSSRTLCLLRLSTQYEITVSAATSKGFGQGLIKTFMTIIGDPAAPAIPTVQSYTTSTITVLLQPVILTTGPLSYYLVSVLRLQGNVGRRRRRRALGLNDLPGNIVARFEPNNLETTFTVGDNATNSGYANPSLKASTIYNVYFAVVSSLDGVTKIAYSDLEAPVLTLSDTPTTTLVATTTPTTTATATTVTTTPVTTTTTTTPITTTANVVTTGGVAAAPTGLAAPSATANDISLTWNDVPGATEYELWYNSTAEPGVVYNTSVPVGGSFLLTGLLPYTTYTLMLRARTSAGLGPFSILTKVTDEDVPSKPGPLSRQNRNETCIWLKWQPPSSPNGIITLYRLTFKATRFFSNVGSVQEESVDVPGAMTTRAICSLVMAAAYEITLKARTSKGYGAGVGETFYTLIGDPEAPSPPEVVSTEETSMIVTLKPVLITTGPLSHYLVKVEKLAGRRKKRATVEDIPGNSVVKIETLDFAGKSEINFKIGSGTVRNGYNNSVLEPGTRYNVRFIVISSLDGATKASFAALSEPVTTKGSISTGQSGSGGDGGVVVYVVVAILAVLVLIAAMIIALWWFRKQRNAKKNYEPEWVGYYKNNFMGEEKVHGIWNETFDLEESRYVLMTKENPADISIGRLRDRPPISIEQEYYKLPQGQQFPCHTAERPENINKNHCSKILAYEHSRVVLRDVESGITDYINANFIDGYKKRKAFIAAQSPFTDETVVDFWRMILQENVSQIVMVTRPIEDGVPKCKQYWPNEGNLKYGKIHVRIVESTDFAHFTVRKFQLFVQEREIKHVSQYHFTSWPDHGCPEDPIPFLEFHHRVKADTHAQDGPILVHCGTGVSRTATFIAIDALTKQAEMEKKVNVWKFANEMRKNRVHMIRTLKQYMYIYDALMEKLIVEEPYVSFNLRKKYKALSQINPSTTKSYFDEQFQTLQRFTPDSKTDDCSGLSVENREKNRYISIMPVDRFRPRILTHGGSNTSDYINAIFIDSYTRHNQFILTQSPMVHTVTDFWKLVYDYQVSLILMLDDRALQDDSCGEYLPPHTSEPVKFDIFQVQLTNVDESPQHVTIRDLKFHNVSRAHEKSRVIRHIQIDEWPMKQHVPTNTDSFMSLLDMAEEWLKEADDPKRVLIHCIDGASHSGLFVSVMCLCEKMRIDGEVDVFHTVKHIKRRRSQVVGNLTQYKFCHKVLWDYMNTRINHKVKGLTSTLANGHAPHDRDDISRLSYDDDEADGRMGTYRLNGNISPIPNGTPHSTMYDTMKDSYDSFTESESAVD
ncbi:receptor-type tyrosine-protein phosphatase delta-like [Lingula anatina]|uniref:protein-tyrosine-phosphatase n=1 Tax=Lingula anatina TaxID=7574 RepID=A0A1S3JVW3_LINAN|nr:receptor-type tyrosine-protein phosphatase delta-like [Lingula anatina]|eukprot:XP_013414194.1 receptor-type tyrosine-protein phosphatase delta-like [Lingula anatina]